MNCVRSAILFAAFATFAAALFQNEKRKILDQIVTVHKHWYQDALFALISSLQAQIQPQISAFDYYKLTQCSNRATELRAKARCLVTALDKRHSPAAHWIGAFKIGQSAAKHVTKPTKQPTKWIGGLGVRKQWRINLKPRRKYYYRRYKRSITKMARMPNIMEPSGQSPTLLLAKLARRILQLPRNSTWRRDLKALRNFKNFHQFSHDSGQSARVLSPKFLPLFGGNSNSFNFLSPELLSLNDGSKLLSLPSLLSSLSPGEQKLWTDIIVEASGASRRIKDFLEKISRPDGRNHWAIFKANQRFAESWLQLSQSYDRGQRRDLASKGYAFLTKDQLLRLYGRQGLFNESGVSLDLDLERYARMTSSEKQLVLEDSIRRLAGHNSALRSWNRRLKQAVLEPAIFSPGILSPGVLGPVTLSPSIFSPGVLSPGALSPATLSPSVGNPAILSPNVLSPGILSPTVLSPAVLSPSALSPAVLNPSALSIAVLSPAVLGPAILSPGVLGGSVLSPSALSPAILSPGVLNADVLSPSVLS